MLLNFEMKVDEDFKFFDVFFKIEIIDIYLLLYVLFCLIINIFFIFRSMISVVGYIIRRGFVWISFIVK